MNIMLINLEVDISMKFYLLAKGVMVAFTLVGVIYSVYCQMSEDTRKSSHLRMLTLFQDHSDK